MFLVVKDDSPWDTAGPFLESKVIYFHLPVKAYHTNVTDHEVLS